MNMATFNVICITLTNVIFVVNAGMTWNEECREQLQINGQFDLLWNKTKAFMHAYNTLIIPVKERTISDKDILHAYQRELFNKFLEAHENHLHDMFEDPMIWCRKNIGKLGDKRRKDLPVEQNCNESMNSENLITFSESRKSALEGIFYGLRNVYTCAYLKGMQKHYLDYVAPIVEKYVVYTSARSPWKYCNDILSPALPLPVDHNGNVLYNLHLNEHKSTQFQSDSNNPYQSSSGASKTMVDIDLKHSPTPEDN